MVLSGLTSFALDTTTRQRALRTQDYPRKKGSTSTGAEISRVLPRPLRGQVGM
jgi:hypothetical protein